MSSAKPHWGWVVVAGSFVSFFIADGWSYTFGMLYPILIEEYGESKGITAYVPTLLYGLPMILSPLACSVLSKVGCRALGIFGGIVFSLSLIVASISSSFWLACLSLGVLTSLGLSSIYVSAFVAVTYWFDDSSRGLATGLAVAGSGIGSIVFPHLFDALMNEYSWRGTVLILSGLAFNSVISGCLYRPFPASATIDLENAPPNDKDNIDLNDTDNIYHNDTDNVDHKVIDNVDHDDAHKNSSLKVIKDIISGSIPDYKLLKNIFFCIYCNANFVLYLCVSIPYLYIYDWAIYEAGLDSDRSAWLLSVIGISRTLGQIIIGLVGDRKGVSPNLLLGVCVAILGVSVFLISFSLHYVPLLLCCIAFGFTVSSTYVLPMLCMGEIIGMQKAVNGFGLIQFIQGVATLIGTPMGGWIYDSTNSYTTAFCISGILIIVSSAILCLIPLMKRMSCRKSASAEENEGPKIDSKDTEPLKDV